MLARLWVRSPGSYGLLDGQGALVARDLGDVTERELAGHPEGLHRRRPDLHTGSNLL